ncbi:hypothetical protein D3C87_851390 [compost metagenome]
MGAGIAMIEVAVDGFLQAVVLGLVLLVDLRQANQVSAGRRRQVAETLGGQPLVAVPRRDVDRGAVRSEGSLPQGHAERRLDLGEHGERALNLPWRDVAIRLEVEVRGFLGVPGSGEGAFQHLSQASRQGRGRQLGEHVGRNRHRGDRRLEGDRRPDQRRDRRTRRAGPDVDLDGDRTRACRGPRVGRGLEAPALGPFPVMREEQLMNAQNDPVALWKPVDPVVVTDGIGHEGVHVVKALPHVVEARHEGVELRLGRPAAVAQPPQPGGSATGDSRAAVPANRGAFRAADRLRGREDGGHAPGRRGRLTNGGLLGVQVESSFHAILPLDAGAGQRSFILRAEGRENVVKSSFQALNLLQRHVKQARIC